MRPVLHDKKLQEGTSIKYVWKKKYNSGQFWWKLCFFNVLIFYRMLSDVLKDVLQNKFELKFYKRSLPKNVYSVIPTIQNYDLKFTKTNINILNIIPK